jgi:hypothetical protein
MERIRHERRLHLEAIAKLDRWEAELERFGGDDSDFDFGTIITWQRQFDGVRTVYTYAAIKTSRGWYLSGSETKPLTWSHLVADHLIEATTESVRYYPKERGLRL